MAPLAMLAYYSITLTSDALASQAEGGAAAVAETTGTSIEPHIKALTDTLGQYAQQAAPRLSEGDPSRFDRSGLQTDLRSVPLTPDGLQRIVVTDASGTILGSAPPSAGDVGPVDGESWYRGVTSTKTPFAASDGTLAGHRDPGTIVIAVPIRAAQNGGRVIGEAAGVYSLRWAQDQVDRIALSRRMTVSLIDRQGAVMVRPASDREHATGPLSDNPALQQALSGRASTAYREDSQNGLYSAYSPLPSLGWVVGVDVSAEATLATISRIRNTVLAVVGSLALVLLSGMLIGVLLLERAERSAALQQQNESLKRFDEAALTVHSRRGQEALDELATTARDLVRGDFSALTVLRRDSLMEVESVATSGLDQSGREAVEELGNVLSERFGIEQPARLKNLEDLYAKGGGEGLPAIGSVVSVPLLAGSRVLGRLLVGRGRDAQPFSEVNEGLLRQLAQHAVAAIDKKRQDEERESFLLELGHKNDQLAQASRLKSEFLANMSHELRTPLSAIIGFSDLLLDGADGELTEDMIYDVGQINGSGKSLLELINEILDLSKIEAGRMQFEIGPVALGVLIDQVIEALRPLADASRIYLRSNLAEGELVAACDSMRVRQVITNLVSNALKFTKEGGVTVGCERLDGMLEISIVDTGIGIPLEAQELIFEEFTQADGSTTRNFGGTGLGLSISRKLIELQGGQMGLDSTVDEGSRFWFRLPTTTADEAGSMPRPEVAPPGQQVSGPQWSGQTRDVILTIDDDASTRHLICRRLEEAGFETLEADSAETALDIVERVQPAAITLDIMMPGMNGWMVLEALKASPRSRDIPVVIVSIVDGKEAALELGASGYLAKPFNKQDLVGSLAQALPNIAGSDVLCVDDDSASRELLARILKQAKINVRLASSGREALKEVSEQVPDAILVDLMMPGMSGFELVARLRSREDVKGVPIIVVSAHELSEEDVTALNGNIDRFLSKAAIGGVDLGATLRQVISGKREAALSNG